MTLKQPLLLICICTVYYYYCIHATNETVSCGVFPQIHWVSFSACFSSELCGAAIFYPLCSWAFFPDSSPCAWADTNTFNNSTKSHTALLRTKISLQLQLHNCSVRHSISISYWSLYTHTHKKKNQIFSSLSLSFNCIESCRYIVVQ